MTLPRAKTRPITVAGAHYRWGAFRSSDALEIRVELDDEPGSQLLARIERDARGEVPLAGPGLAAALIEAGLAEGWAPASKTPREFPFENAQALAREHDLRTRKTMVCVVLAPLDAGAARVRDTIARAVRELGLQVRDAAEASASASMVTTLTSWIDEADLVIADISRKNPNVMYEVGYAHALGKQTILLVDGSNERGVPDALSGNLFFTYSPNDLSTLHAGLKKAVLRSVRSVASR